MRIKVEVPGLSKMRKIIESNPALSSRVSDAWATRFRAWVRQRFAAFSRGAGDWAPLRLVTLLRRRRARAGLVDLNAAILRDTGALFASTQPTLGNTGLIKSTKHKLGFTAELGGNGGELGRIALYHQTGAGKLPQRKIMEKPPAKVTQAMANDAKKLIVEYLNGR